MSHHYSISSAILDLKDLLQTFSELQIQYKKVSQMATCTGKIEKVEMVLMDPNNRQIGVQKDGKGAYNLIADSTGLSESQLKAQLKFVNRIKQRCAYNKIVAQLRNQGYIITDEQKTGENTIKLAARKWG